MSRYATYHISITEITKKKRCKSKIYHCRRSGGALRGNRNRLELSQGEQPLTKKITDTKVHKYTGTEFTEDEKIWKKEIKEEKNTRVDQIREEADLRFLRETKRNKRGGKLSTLSTSAPIGRWYLLLRENEFGERVVGFSSTIMFP